MQQQLSLRLLPAQAADDNAVLALAAQQLGIGLPAIAGFYRLKQSIDARSRQQVWINLTIHIFINEPFANRICEQLQLRNVNNAAKEVLIIGAGPAGLFAALQLIELGIRPIIIERGKDVRSRRRDLAQLNKEGVVNPESNYCFGEGGAGTYSDGKLYTRSNKRGSINRILNAFVQFGAEENILYQSHPHIGTNKLPHIITAMREQIIGCGGKVLFEKKLVDITIVNNAITQVITADGDCIPATAVILATGHSARDIFTLLHQKNILIESKPFALGVRIEHPQVLIDQLQYHCNNRGEFLPPAAYSLVEQVNNRGVFSFCMCPGGIIAPAATNPGELVVNGWSPSKRNNPYANSGMVVQVDQKDAFEYLTKTNPANKNMQIDNPLLLMHFQAAVEQKAFVTGGGKLVAPAQRMVDFCTNNHTAMLPQCSYLPGLQSADLRTVLPGFIHQALQGGFKAFAKKMNGYYTNEATVVATESRTSSPVRIPRDEEGLHHPQIKNLYPCAEGAGYAGGIVSAAMDGEKVATIIAAKWGK